MSDWPYVILVPTNTVNLATTPALALAYKTALMADSWCREEFGPPENKEREGRWFAEGRRFFFKNVADATLFKLRWSC